jgi:[ribosomal protein S18]-alanine N-acetyltransferase
VDYTLRDFQAGDFDVLWRIDQLCFAPGIAYSRRELMTYIRYRGAFTLVARSASSNGSRPSSNEFAGIAGFIVAEANRRTVGHIISIDVLPHDRRHGLGSQLLAAAEDRLKSSGCSVVVLETAVDNAPALAFYKRHQYSVVKTSPRYYANGVDALVLEKNLTGEPVK